MSKIWIYGFWKPARIDRTNPRPVPGPMVIGILSLSLITVLIGVQPDPLHVFATEAAAELADSGTYLRAVLGAAAPAALELP